jgi:hypothetical protein
VEPPHLEAPGLEAARSEARLEPPRSTPARLPALQPLSPARYKIQFTAGPELHDDLERLQALMRSEVPDGDLAAIIAKAVREMRQRLEARRFAQVRSPRKPTSPPDGSSRHVPAEVRRLVYRRDGSQCRFLDAEGRRCPERHRLEYHHQHAFGLGGGPEPDNICLVCGPHNRYLAERDYGRKKMSQYWRSTREGRDGARTDACSPDADGVDPPK